MKWKKEHKMASMNAMPMHQMHPALAYGHHPMVIITQVSLAIGYTATICEWNPGQ